MSALWTVDMATTTIQSPRLTQQYQMTAMTSPPSPVNRVYAAIKLLADRLCPHGAVCFRLAVIFPGDFVSQFVPRGSASPGDLELENIFEDHEVSWLIIDEMFALELETYRRCFPCDCRTTTGASAPTSCETSPLCRLTVHSSPSSFKDLTHRWWTEREDNDTDIVDVHALAAAVYIHFKFHSARYPDPVPYQFPDPQQSVRPLADLLTAMAALLARRPPHNAPLLHSAWTIQEVVTEECRILLSVNYELGTHPSLQAAPLLVVSAAVSAVSAPAPFTGSS